MLTDWHVNCISNGTLNSTLARSIFYACEWQFGWNRCYFISRFHNINTKTCIPVSDVELDDIVKQLHTQDGKGIVNHLTSEEKRKKLQVKLIQATLWSEFNMMLLQIVWLFVIFCTQKECRNMRYSERRSEMAVQLVTDEKTGQTCWQTEEHGLTPWNWCMRLKMYIYIAQNILCQVLFCTFLGNCNVQCKSFAAS